MSDERADRLPWEVDQVTCWDCGQVFNATGWSADGNPVCARCLNHRSFHLKFDPRCPLCHLERRQAQKESLHLEAWQQSRLEREVKDATADEE
jgi:hypothetical protein